MERHGISAIIIEDKEGLKQNSLFGTEAIQLQSSIDDFCNKISVGKKAQITPDFMIIARIESLICGRPVEDALERAHAYVAAGADGIMIHSKETTGKDIEDFCKKFRLQDKNTPVVAVPTTYNKIYENDLQSWGINIVIYANHLLRSAYPAMLQTAQSILKHSRTKETDKYCMTIKEILTLIPSSKHSLK